TGTAGIDLDRAAELRGRWARLVTEGRELLGPDGHVGQALGASRLAWKRFIETRAACERLLHLDADRAWGMPNAPDALATTRGRLSAWRERSGTLRDWCAWRRVRTAAIEAGLAPFVDACERGAIRTDDLRPVFDRSYYQWWHTAVVDADPVLAGFFSPEHERRIEQFRQVDEAYLELTQKLIAARLAERIPASTLKLPSSELGILKREIGKKRRHMSVRKLFQKIPNLLPRLAPCLLTSPMSVAQYLDAAHPPFDIVVFDEASQIPVWDAVGAIARGAQAVIVGDPKQLPPTTFFDRVDDETDDTDEELEIVEDLESILDDCISAAVPVRRANWHYRSRHESLIAFSNHHYYDNRLFTFPSPFRDGMGVSWRHVPGGVYDKGRSRTNRLEADEVVAEIVRRLRDPDLSRYSIGVVTFSIPQQRLIEDLLEKVRRDAPEIDVFFSDAVPEPVFVKNLENVQGDERDVILFSIGYGPDAQGRVSMNFGPMNRAGGERRLNVAITRSRTEVLVVSTLRPEQIDLARTRARGVHDLKHFLEYAARGPSAIAEATQYDPTAAFDSPFEKEVSDRLVALGWQVHRQVGCSGYRIDLAVVDPDAPGRYLLGIECDGANYHRAKTARDRDKLREGVLRGLGWSLHRVWSTDWWTNREREMEKLTKALDEAKLTPKRAQPGRNVAKRDDSDERFASAGARPVEVAPRNMPPAPPVYEPYSGGPRVRTSDFYDDRTKRLIGDVIADVVQAEGPVSLELVARRVAGQWGMERMTTKAITRITGLIPTDVRVERDGERVFLWPDDRDPDSYDHFRVPGTDPDSEREADDLPLQEIAAAALDVLRQHLSASRDDLAREAGRLFGFQRSGRIVQERMHAGIDRLTAAGYARQDGDRVVLVGP
ncbi:MAG: DUF3320 domain-containing protein, partial [Planctomycetes bacterium]|nr:DUF3320 domain-containing protein [Planctomycetota bacterium]